MLISITSNISTQGMPAWSYYYSLQEDRWISRLIWTVEMQSWETDCRTCCLANQTPQSMRVKCKKILCQCKYRLPSVSITLLLFCIPKTCKNVAWWCRCSGEWSLLSMILFFFFFCCESNVHIQIVITTPSYALQGTGV